MENVIATRERLKTLKEKLKSSTRGHDLLKNKCDELVKNYASLFSQTYRLKLKMNKIFASVIQDFTIASSFQSQREVQREFLLQANIFSLEFSTTTRLGITLPDIKLHKENFDDFPYAFASSNILFDDILDDMKDVFSSMVKLSELEKSCAILAGEIEMLKKRVNSLEFIQIPRIKEEMAYISMKLDENNSYNIVRLLKAKNLKHTHSTSEK